MKLDNHSSSQLNATADDTSARRSKNPQDVVFVDEDGNPIEAGHENLLYVDESGHEIPEDIALQLLETGKYMDSRDLCLETPANETQPRSSNATFLSNASASNTTPANGSHPSHSASLPASAFGSLSKATGARQQRDLQQASDVVVRKAASSQILLQASTVVGADVQTRTQTQHSSFVTNEAAQRSYQREKELDQVELDNVSFRLDASELQRKATANDNYTKSVSNVDMQKSQSARRLIQPPPKRTDTRQSNDSYISSQQASQKQYRYQASPSTAPACQTYNLNQLVESPSTPQPTSSAQRHQLPSQSPYVSSAYEYQPSENNLTQQQYEEEANREEEEAAYAVEEQQLRQRQQDIIDNEILRSSSQPPESPYYYDPQSQSQSQQQQRQPSRLSQYSQASRSTNSRPLTNQRLQSAASSHRDLGPLGQFEVVQFRRLGDLRGDQIIRDISQLTDDDINRLYSLNEDPEAAGEEDSSEQNDEQFIDPADPNLFKDEIVDIDFGAIDAYTSALNAQINSVNNESSAANDLQFPSHILTSSHATFLDNQLLLGDAFYGRDDDVAAASDNANNETNGDDNASNAEVACNPAGFSVQLLNSFKDFENLGAQAHEDDLQSNQGGQSNHNNNNEQTNNQENAEYSNSHSFGSVVDIDNCQPGYTIGDLSNFNLSNFNLNSSHQNYELLDPSGAGSKHNVAAKPSSRQQPTSSSGVFYLNSENQENCYVR